MATQVANASGRVVYWTHHALRCDENPALDVAIHLANALELPLVVYQGLSERYRFASDRHHTFILQAAEELQREYSVRGIPYVLHVERVVIADRVSAVAATSSVIVTDDFPVEATREWTERLCSCRAAIVAVDTACVVPMQKVGRAFDRAFAFRSATEKLFRERWKRSWPECPKLERVEETLPFSTLDLSRTSVAEVLAQCDIDHSIGPVPDTRGGGRAGYARWTAFVDRGLTQYAKRRNAIEIDGVSRMSAYLHYGMVSPMRVAREAAALLPKEGAEKYLDELLIWRELAYGFCFYRNDVDSCDALPRWLSRRSTPTLKIRDPRFLGKRSRGRKPVKRFGTPRSEVC